MKDKFKKALRDPLFIRLILLAVAMAALAVVAVIMYGKPALSYPLQFVYVAYAVILFFFIRTLIRLYLIYFREKKEKKESAFGKKVKKFFRAAQEKLRDFFNLKPRDAFFGGTDQQFDAEDIYTSKRGKNDAARIKWSMLNKNPDKIRYLYAERVSEGIAGGADIVSSDTARQVEGKIEKRESDGLLFGLYESVRYTDHNVDIDNGTVSYLSEKNTVKKRKKK